MKNKFLKRSSDGQIDWSVEGIAMLTDIMNMGVGLTCCRMIGDILVDRGFDEMIRYERYVLSDDVRVVEVILRDESCRVVRDGLIYGFDMRYDQGGDELCDLWDNIRKAWVG